MQQTLVTYLDAAIGTRVIECLPRCKSAYARSMVEDSPTHAHVHLVPFSQKTLCQAITLEPG